MRGACLDRAVPERTVRRDDVLSGGERQRVGFARTLFYFSADARPSRYAILDEATSASAC